MSAGTTTILIGEEVQPVRYYYSKGRPATRWEPDEPAELCIEEVFFINAWAEPSVWFTAEEIAAAEERLGEKLAEEEAANEQDYWDGIAEDRRMGEME